MKQQEGYEILTMKSEKTKHRYEFLLQLIGDGWQTFLGFHACLLDVLFSFTMSCKIVFLGVRAKEILCNYFPFLFFNLAGHIWYDFWKKWEEVLRFKSYSHFTNFIKTFLLIRRDFKKKIDYMTFSKSTFRIIKFF